MAAIWTAAVLSVLFVWGSSLVSVAGTSVYTIVVSCTVIFLFLSFTFPIALGFLAVGNAEMGQDGARGTWGAAVFTLFAMLSILSMILIFVIGIQPPNDWALYITRRLLHPDGDRLVRVREQALPGSADRRHDRQAPGRDRGGREGGRRDLTLANVAKAARAGLIPARVR